ncbi:hypothetical protein O2N63_13005 [Aliiroseovarius sp. KMU-50]|uniref:Terminase large subunit gp17-like C-terminal domain-containing protein n=1 Tax=Aliiroseovarius salicola TaxID=3009082 RepID=A0ABT4W3B6_9RHOB|nr:hypothetical protein [Aliiroseovarius sp. KMU-50]MDA5095002.1 hypothetical protein [Aliiroseovarius sp. KMU-50]
MRSFIANSRRCQLRLNPFPNFGSKTARRQLRASLSGWKITLTLLMTTRPNRVLSIAVAYGKLAYVFIINDRLKDWQVSRAASFSPTKAGTFLKNTYKRLQPDIVLIEDPREGTRKTGHALEILLALEKEIVAENIPHHCVRRRQSYANKYEEARALAERYPPIETWLPKSPRIWEGEPTNTIYFEALSMHVQMLKDT